MNLLVAGGEEVDAGKTTFTTGLLARTGGTGFKPRAGNDFWYDHDDYRRAAGDGRLYGKDAHRLADASGLDGPPEAINPVHRLWQPTPGSGSGILGREGRSFLVDRVGEEYVVNGTTTLPDRVRDDLPLEGATAVESVREFNAVMRELHVPAMQDLAETVAGADLAVVESYADVARPLSEFVPTAVAVVEPTRVRVYDGDRYVKGCEVASGGTDVGTLEERVDDVTDLVEPATSEAIPPLTDEQRRDAAAVANAYEAAYDALLSVAGDRA